MSVQDVVESDVLERVLGTAMRTGGEFAEVFIEDKRSTIGRARRRADRTGHQRSRPRRRHPGRQGRDDRLRPHRRPQRGRPAAAAEAAAAAASQGAGGANASPSPAAEHRVEPGRAVPDEVVQGRRRSALLQRVDEAARASGGAIVQVAAGYGDSRKRSSSPTPTACWPPTSRSATRADQRRRQRRRRHADGVPERSATRSASRCSTTSTSRNWPATLPARR